MLGTFTYIRQYDQMNAHLTLIKVTKHELLQKFKTLNLRKFLMSQKHVRGKF